MSAVTDQQNTESRSQERRRKLQEKRAGKSSSRPESKGGRRKSGPPKPPAKVEPGWIHEAIAAVGLKALQALAEKKGVNLSVGQIDKENVTPSVVSGDI